MLNVHNVRLASGDRLGPAPSPVPSGRLSTSAAPWRVIIIEDELMVAWALEGTLESLGHEIMDIYPTGESALAAGLGGATLLIVDINLGSGIDGIATASELRRTASVPIIFCSAYSDPQTRLRAMEAVPDAAFVTKPFVERDIKEAIRAATRVRH
jgi:DNA-binding response OmpR family regulator